MRSVRSALMLAIAVLCTAAAPARAAGVVTVNFVDPALFDAGRGIARDRNLERLAQHLRRLGEQRLPDGETLAIDVLDVRLAGEAKPWVAAQGRDFRVLNGGADGPRMHLRYTLSRPGQAPAASEDRLNDLGYMDGLQSTNTGQPLYYEKRMLDEWFAARFGAAAANP